MRFQEFLLMESQVLGYVGCVGGSCSPGYACRLSLGCCVVISCGAGRFPAPELTLVPEGVVVGGFPGSSCQRVHPLLSALVVTRMTGKTLGTPSPTAFPVLGIHMTAAHTIKKRKAADHVIPRDDGNSSWREGTQNALER